jgi:hypothetical protein
MTAPIAPTAKTHPSRELAGRLPKVTARFSPKVGPVERTAAIRAFSLAYLLGQFQIDSRQLPPKTCVECPVVPHVMDIAQSPDHHELCGHDWTKRPWPLQQRQEIQKVLLACSRGSRHPATQDLPASHSS